MYWLTPQTGGELKVTVADVTGAGTSWIWKRNIHCTLTLVSFRNTMVSSNLCCVNNMLVIYFNNFDNDSFRTLPFGGEAAILLESKNKTPFNIKINCDHEQFFSSWWGRGCNKGWDTDPCIDIPGWWNYMTSQTAQTGPRSNSSPGHNTSRASCSICQQMWKKNISKSLNLMWL